MGDGYALAISHTGREENMEHNVSSIIYLYKERLFPKSLFV